MSVFKIPENGDITRVPQTNISSAPSPMATPLGVAWHPSGNFIFVATTGGLVRCDVDQATDTFTWQPLMSLTASNPLIAISPDGNLILSGRGGAPYLHAHTFNGTTLTAVTPESFGATINGLDFSPDGKSIIATSTLSSGYFKIGTISGSTITWSTQLARLENAANNTRVVFTAGGNAFLAYDRGNYNKLQFFLRGSDGLQWPYALGGINARAILHLVRGPFPNRLVSAQNIAATPAGAITVYEINYLTGGLDYVPGLSIGRSTGVPELGSAYKI